MTKVRKFAFISLIIISLVAVLTVPFVYAYFYQEKEIEEEKTFGHIQAISDVYFIKNGRIEASYSNTVNGHVKEGVYQVDVSNLDNNFYISNLNVDIKVKTNIDAYIRVMIDDALIIRRQTSDGGYRELSSAITDLNYNFDDNWFYDETSNWYYYIGKIEEGDNWQVFDFIEPGTLYDLLPNRRIELIITVEAVQAHLGAEKNWGMTFDGENWKKEAN